MATEVGGMPNGYAHHQGYAGMDQNSYAYAANAATSQASVPPTSSTPSNAPSAQQQPQSEISKDEVGWYFVEQYYTTLSRSPEKLYLFYNKRSQFVSGQETDKVPVCVGQRAINDKIRDLDFQDCKVRVTNVDSQSSDSNIVIQVIGEISNKSQPHRKFTQTFVLATQTNGYFVLNDIFRYLVEEEDEPEAETAQQVEDIQQVSGTESNLQEAAPAEAEPKTLTSSTDPAAVEHDAAQVDKVLDEKVVNHVEKEEPAPVVNGESAPAEEAAVEEVPATTAAPEAAQAKENERPATTESEIQPEKPKDPEPTPVASPPKQAAPKAAPAPKPSAPAAPKTWANLAAAANRVATPAAPQPAPSSATSATSRPAAKAAPTAPSAPSAAPSAPAAAAAAAPSGPAAQRQEASASDSQDEWTAVGGSHNRQQSRQTNVAQPEQPQNRGYIKNVHENVNYDELKAELEKFGELSYFDIARQKVCYANE